MAAPDADHAWVVNHLSDDVSVVDVVAGTVIATVPVGYGDGLSRRLSNNLDLLVHGVRCSQVGRITMDMSLLDVTALRETHGTWAPLR